MRRILQTLVFSLCAALVAGNPVFAAASTLFSYGETRSENLAPFTKWSDMLTRHPEHLKAMHAQCENDTQCAIRKWEETIANASQMHPTEQLQNINRFINEHPYVIDSINWGQEDYWETPHEFFSRNGDCEDYAIAKYKTLKMLGFDEKKMRIVILNDLNLGVIHAVLVVEREGKRLILDNQIEEVLRDEEILHYKPVYSINEHSWWRHVPAY